MINEYLIMAGEITIKTYSLKLTYFITMLILLYIAYNTIFESYSQEQKLTIMVLAVAIYLWTLSSIPTGAASILILTLILFFNLVESVEEAFIGFTSPALYFILILSILSSALIKVGIDKIVIQQLLKISNKGPFILMIIFPFLMIILPILIPSAFARFKMLLPFIENLNNSFGFNKNSRFMKYSLYVIGLMNQNATIIVFTGGGFPVLAHQLMRDYSVANLGWLEWFFMVAPPLWAGLFIVNIFVRIYLFKTTPEDVIEYAHDAKAAVEKQNESEEQNVSKEQKTKFVLISFIIMILSWALIDQNLVPTLVPPMILLVIFSLPNIGVLNNKDIKNFDWESFLLLGSAFSLGIIMEANGTALMIAENLISLIDEEQLPILKIVSIGLFIFIFRMVFIVPSSALIVIFPITMSYADLLDIPEINLAFLVVFIIGCSNIFPIHAPPSYFAYLTGALTRKDHYVIATFSTLILVSIAILSSLLYWSP